MEQKRISMGQRMGYFFLALLPFIAFIGIQLLASVVFVLVSMVQTLIPYAYIGRIAPQILAELQYNVLNMVGNHLMEINIVYQVIALAAFGIWYYFMVVYRHKVTSQKAFGIQAAIGIPLLGVGVEIVISFVLGMFSIIFPKIMEDYAKLLEEAGLDVVTPAVLIATVILAPLVEELVFRGVTLYYAQKMTKHFWIANVLQALLFGIGHMNLVQGTYAFILGIIMGCVYYKYRSIKATILLHAAFNLVGTVVAEASDAALSQNNLMMVLSIELMMVLSGIIGLTLVLTDHKKNESSKSD